MAVKNLQGYKLGTFRFTEKGGASAWDPRPLQVALQIVVRRLQPGSSILASLSEAGGNDPYHPVSGPLPPHLQNDADRVGTRPTPYSLQVTYPNAQHPPSLARSHSIGLTVPAAAQSRGYTFQAVRIGNANPALKWPTRGALLMNVATIFVLPTCPLTPSAS
jgi:hypothetical protein